MKDYSSFIADNIILYGDLELEGNLRLDGIISGQVQCKKTITIGEEARIDGNILAKDVHSSGEINGTVQAKKKVYLTKNARLTGEVQAANLEAENTASFDGSVEIK